jgi:hypothetical protein
VAGFLGGLFDGRASAQDDQVGQRDFLASLSSVLLPKITQTAFGQGNGNGSAAGAVLDIARWPQYDL